jgi:hypothetical protein
MKLYSYFLIIFSFILFVGCVKIKPFGETNAHAERAIEEFRSEFSILANERSKMHDGFAVARPRTEIYNMLLFKDSELMRKAELLEEDAKELRRLISDNTCRDLVRELRSLAGKDFTMNNILNSLE